MRSILDRSRRRHGERELLTATGHQGRENGRDDATLDLRKGGRPLEGQATVAKRRDRAVKVKREGHGRHRLALAERDPPHR